ncbi:MAG: hypothetical protein Kow00114_17890 [Kiloniellaceae bacterium]
MQRDGAEWSELDLQQFLTRFTDPRFEALIRHWLALRQQDTVPSRSAIDPSQFRSLLDSVWLLERHPDGHYRYRLTGQTITEIHGGLRRGTNPAELFRPEAVDMFRLRWEAAFDHGKLVRAQGFVQISDGEHTAAIERLMMPLRGDDGSVSIVLGATNYRRPRGSGLTTAIFPPTYVQVCAFGDLPLGSNR